MDSLVDGSKRLSAFKKLSDLSEKHAFPVVISAGGSVFIMGGTADGQTGSKTVLRAKLDRTKNSLGTFLSDGRDLPSPLFARGGATIGNYVFYFGGKTGSSGEGVLSNKVFMNSVGFASTASLSRNWTEVGTLPSYLSEMSVATRGEYVYLIGGIASDSDNVSEGFQQNFSNKVYFTEVDKNGGISNFKEASSLPIPLYRTATVVVGDRIYVFGSGTVSDGESRYFAEDNPDKTNVISSKKIFAADIKKDGTLSAWQDLGELPEVREGHFVFFGNGYFYLISGYSFLGRENDENKFTDLGNEIITARLDPESGKIGSWSGNKEGSVPSFLGNDAVFDGGLTEISGSLVLVAGRERFGGVTSGSKRVYLASMLSGDPANTSLSSFSETKSLPESRSYPTLQSWLGNLYLIGGGKDDGYLGSDGVYSQAVASDSAEWQTAATLPKPLLYNQSVILNGYLYVLGGVDKYTKGKPNEVYGDVYLAKIKSGGKISSFKNATPLPAARWQFAATTLGSRIYILGGVEGDKDNFKRSDTVYYADQNPDGSLSSWQQTESLPIALSSAAATSYGGSIYLAGGALSDASNFSAASSAVYKAEVGKSGSLSPFKELTSLPERRMGAMLVSARGGLIILGGFETANLPSPENYYAPLKADGTISSLGWQNMSYPGGYLADAGGVVADSSSGDLYLYLAGGRDLEKELATSKPSLSGRVYFSKLYPQTQKGDYSALGYLSGTFDLLEVQKITRLIWNSSSGAQSGIIKSVYAEEKSSGTEISLRFRTSAEGKKWSAWSDNTTSDYLNVLGNARFVQFEGVAKSSSDRLKAPEIFSFALTKDDSGGNGSQGKEKQLAGSFGDVKDTVGIQTNGFLPATETSTWFVVLVALAALLIFAFIKRIWKNRF